MALKLGLGAALLVTVVVAVIGAALRGGSVPHFVEAMFQYPNRALIVFAWTTIGFAVLDYAGSRTQLKPDWDPRKIPDWMVGPGRQERLHDRAHAIVEVIFGILGLGWLLLVPTSPWLAMGPLSTVLDFAPVWSTWYIPLVAVRPRTSCSTSTACSVGPAPRADSRSSCRCSPANSGSR